jgi:UDP-N-acetylmuramoyl-L-alanyl-D-glutamate--2,6-diaminopimelate ligase
MNSPSPTVFDVLGGATAEVSVPNQIGILPVAGLEYDSRKVEPGFLFFAFPGAKVDGRQFAVQAIHKGATAVVSELEAPEEFAGPWIRVPQGRKALAAAAKRFYGAPDEKLGITGITGTNGKTTTSYLIDSVLRAAGNITAVVGTIEYHLAGRVMKAPNTTPESLDLFRMFDELLRSRGSKATMEVSSHALSLGRVHGIHFHTGVFTNLTRDHLDFHGTMESYFDAKRQLFAPEGAPAPPHAVLNADDDWSYRVDSPSGTNVYWYGIGDRAEYRALDIRFSFEGLEFRLKTPSGETRITSPLTGRHNVYNILAAICAGLSYGIDMATVTRGIRERRNVPGRFERIDMGQPFLVVVDYAHTDDALRNLIGVARALEPKRVITLFGCGGDRDRTKRPLMAMAAAELSDYVVLTSDNPRSEDPLAIINDALVGLRRFDTQHLIEPDRHTAIQRAIQRAEEGDIVLIAGKGHEPYQVLKDATIDFDDREIAREVLRGMGYGRKGRS